MLFALKFVSFMAMTIGLLAVLAVIFNPEEGDGYTLFGGALFFTQGTLSLMYINEKGD